LCYQLQAVSRLNSLKDPRRFQSVPVGCSPSSECVQSRNWWKGITGYDPYAQKERMLCLGQCCRLRPKNSLGYHTTCCDQQRYPRLDRSALLLLPQDTQEKCVACHLSYIRSFCPQGQAPMLCRFCGSGEKLRYGCLASRPRTSPVGMVPYRRRAPFEPTSRTTLKPFV